MRKWLTARGEYLNRARGLREAAAAKLHIPPPHDVRAIVRRGSDQAGGESRVDRADWRAPRSRRGGHSRAYLIDRTGDWPIDRNESGVFLPESQVNT
jgi:hypothetical protein